MNSSARAVHLLWLYQLSSVLSVSLEVIPDDAMLVKYDR